MILGLEHGVLMHRGIMCTDENGDVEELLEHVLWYVPAGDDAGRRLERLRLVESLLAFGSAFSSKGERVDTVLLSTSRYVFVEVEAEVWLVWAVSVEAEPAAVQSLMVQAYDAWALFEGRILESFPLDAVGELAAARKAARKARERGETVDEARVEDAVAASPTTRTREALARRFARVPRDASAANSLDDMVGFEHCGAEPMTFLAAHRAQRELANFLPIVQSTLFYRSSILWTGLDVAETLPLYQRVLRTTPQQRGFAPSPVDDRPIWRVRLGAAKLPHPLDHSNWVLATRDGPDLSPLETRAAVYRLADLTAILFFHRDTLDLSDLQHRLDASLTPLVAALKHRAPRPRGSPVEGCDFVYFNRGNVSLKLGFEEALPPPALRSLDDAHRAFMSVDGPTNNNIQEVAIPLPARSGWLIAKHYHKRLIFLLLDARYADFRDAVDVLRGLKAGLLSNIAVLP
ncbi:hypothetical protein CTAYLR_000266 [Chrysophaeum taylorii]|uniref:CCZ1/INTU/HSP4 first Longin domain-containing protein n=1 Tax=Chrysophaeum taylorii TaxID=2483200 RepID=A0AAD7XJ44_9STRA|nr:hypothetical protein CTAYLR_000266 [Chrysophaeum taylorii]